jgi:hypothetical protein
VARFGYTLKKSELFFSTEAVSCTNVKPVSESKGETSQLRSCSSRICDAPLLRIFRTSTNENVSELPFTNASASASVCAQEDGESATRSAFETNALIFITKKAGSSWINFLH